MNQLRRLSALLLVSIMLVACGGGGGSSASEQSQVAQPDVTDPSSDPDPTNPDQLDPADVAARATMTWAAPTQREDGSPLSEEEIANYEIYHLSDEDGSMDVITVAGDATEYSIDLTAGSHELGVAVVDVNGNRSQMSEMQTVQIN